MGTWQDVYVLGGWDRGWRRQGVRAQQIETNGIPNVHVPFALGSEGSHKMGHMVKVRSKRSNRSKPQTPHLFSTVLHPPSRFLYTLLSSTSPKSVMLMGGPSNVTRAHSRLTRTCLKRSARVGRLGEAAAAAAAEAGGAVSVLGVLGAVEHRRRASVPYRTTAPSSTAPALPLGPCLSRDPPPPPPPAAEGGPP